ncbi:hypothetical protein A2U01_0069260, partial [Trifolium medium]|nr:hypothetical protein [Trifolium medium]
PTIWSVAETGRVVKKKRKQNKKKKLLLSSKNEGEVAMFFLLREVIE